MRPDLARKFRPVAPPRLIDDTYSEDQHRRLMDVVRQHGPWQLILAENFSTPEEVIATTSGKLPEGVKLTWEMLLHNPVFRGYLARPGVCFYPELEDCYYNSRFLELFRRYWGAKYAEPETFLFNIQGPTPIGGPPHLDATVFRGMTWRTRPSGSCSRWPSPASSGAGRRIRARSSPDTTAAGSVAASIAGPTGPNASPSRSRRRCGAAFATQSDPMNDRDFVALVSQVYDIGGPTNVPADAVDEQAA